MTKYPMVKNVMRCPLCRHRKYLGDLTCARCAIVDMTDPEVIDRLREYEKTVKTANRTVLCGVL